MRQCGPWYVVCAGCHKLFKRLLLTALVKKRDRDMILPSILAMDKTHIDLAGHLQMEPITISHGLLKHSMRSKPIAMQILGYINHSSLAHILPQEINNKTTSNSNASRYPLPPGTHRWCPIEAPPKYKLANIHTERGAHANWVYSWTLRLLAVAKPRI